jgi:hypothetical protein
MSPAPKAYQPLVPALVWGLSLGITIAQHRIRRSVMNGTLLLVALSAALLVAAGVLMIGVGRIVFGIMRERKKPSRVVHHPDLGVLTGNGDLWEGTAHPEGRKVPFLVTGEVMVPDETMLRVVGEIVAHFSETEDKALAFLRDREPEARETKLDFYPLDVADRASFTMEFVDQDDDCDRVWRVEFESGTPKCTSFDD